ncbi:MAG: antitoxin family protein [Nitrospirae bacterium]|nr:antitoxin family protein [Nitrospirota bacterium]
MFRTIEAIYEDGVFKPKKKLSFPEHSRIKLTIVSDNEWIGEFKTLLKKVHSRTKKFPSKEIEKDITLASKESCLEG